MSGLIKEITDAQFSSEVISSNVPVLVDFWATWCGPCVAMVPVLEELATEYNGKVTFAKLNIEENKSMATQLGVMYIPTFILFKDGTEQARISGVVSKRDLIKKIEENIGA